MAEVEIGVFGGSGFYSLLAEAEEIEVETPYGKPSAPVVLGELGGRRVAFLPRHGRRHELPPHRIPYRANLWAMKKLGVRRVIGPCASGALRADLRLGEFLVCDQLPVLGEILRPRTRGDGFCRSSSADRSLDEDRVDPDHARRRSAQRAKRRRWCQAQSCG